MIFLSFQDDKLEQEITAKTYRLMPIIVLSVIRKAFPFV